MEKEREEDEEENFFRRTKYDFFFGLGLHPRPFFPFQGHDQERLTNKAPYCYTSTVGFEEITGPTDPVIRKLRKNSSSSRFLYWVAYTRIQRFLQQKEN